MNKEVYEFRDILFNLRKTYQKNRKQLDELKQLVSVSKTIGDYGFTFYKYYNSDDTILLFKYLLSCYDIQGILEGKHLYYNLSNVRIYNNEVIIDNNVKIKITNKDKFINKVNEILNSDFIKLITKYNIKSLDNGNSILSFDINGMNLNTNQTLTTNTSSLFYDAYSDVIGLTTNNILVNETIINDMFHDLLGVQFYKNEFSNYILEQIKFDESRNTLYLSDYYINRDNTKTFIYNFSNNKKLIKSKNSIF